MNTTSSANTSLNQPLNAVILAAGKSTRFAPFTYEKPKGLFQVRGEVLIERQIEQLTEAGVQAIYIVVGYMKEKFFYLEQKYPNVHLLINNRFSAKGNLYSLYIAREFLCNTFLSYADYYFEHNPFLQHPQHVAQLNGLSYHCGVYSDLPFDGFAAHYTDAHVISHIDMGGKACMRMTGHAYFSPAFGAHLRALMEAEINLFRVSSLFWEEFFARHIHELTLFAIPSTHNDVKEFNSIDDLLAYDNDFLYNVNSDIISNICQCLHCQPNAITDIAVINAGLTNVSFSFKVQNVQYVYRHPGGTAGHLINRQTEIYFEHKALQEGIDRSVITVSPNGWKLSYCVQDLVPCNFRLHDDQLALCMDYLRRMHALPTPANNEVKVFDDLQEAIHLMTIASLTKGNLLREFDQELRLATRLDQYLKFDAQRLGIPLACCHNDIYEPNFLCTQQGDMYLIDWEYAGLNDPANDLACFFCRYDYSQQDIDRFIRAYFGHEPSHDEYRHYTAFIPLCAFYWMGWGFYKGSVGDDDGFFFLPAYRNFHRFIHSALAAFEQDEAFMAQFHSHTQPTS